MISLLHEFGYEYDPPFTWSALAVLALAVLLVLRVALGNRWPGRGRLASLCPGCGYDLRGIAAETRGDVRCAECGRDCGAGDLMARPRRTRLLLVIALLFVVAAHVTALWPQTRSNGWPRLLPSTLLVLQPMDVKTWTDVQSGWSKPVRAAPSPGRELGRRLDNASLWAWQEWILLRRVEFAFGSRDESAATRIYDITDLPNVTWTLYYRVELVTHTITPGDWVDHGGTANAAFEIADHLVIRAPARVHAEIEDMLADIRAALAAGPPRLPPFSVMNPRDLTVRGEHRWGVLDRIRIERSVSIESLRAAGPTFADGVTEDELDACERNAFGLLDRMRRNPDD